MSRACATLAFALLAAASHASGAASGGPDPVEVDVAAWIDVAPDGDDLLASREAIDAQNTLLVGSAPSMRDLLTFPERLAGEDVASRIRALSSRPAGPRFDSDGNALGEADWARLDASLALDAIPATVGIRFGLVVHRADLRTFPTPQRVFSRPGDSDIDRFQESALFPGTPVAILHSSADGAWQFVASPRYQAWIEARHVAVGPRDEVLGYLDRIGSGPRRVVTGAVARTVTAPEAPALSNLVLDMGVAVPVARHLPEGPVNGQHPGMHWPVELPVRDAEGRLVFAPALLPRIEDTRPGVLPLTRANLLRQSFKFLGERYGWGHWNGGRDCSGFVSEVYRSMGVLLPRNTGDQAAATALDRTDLSGAPPADRMAALDALEVGDLVYIPGHVMLVIGERDGATHVVHDIHGGHMRDAEGTIRPMHFNGVVVTPLDTLVAGDGTPFTALATTIVRPHRIRATR
ncbi:SH3 domain-containing protein [Luteimonas pelagia]